MKSRFLDCKKSVTATMKAIAPSSEHRTMISVEFQTAAGRFQFADRDGMRASKNQPSPKEELTTILAATSHPSDSPTRVVKEMRQKPIRGNMARMSTMGTAP